MADIGRLDPVLAEKRLFEREDAKQQVDHPPHRLYAAFAPRPDLRGDEVNHRDAEPFQLARDGKMEIRGVGKDREIGLFPRGSARQCAKSTKDARQMADYFDDADNRQILRADYWPNARFAHVGTGAAEEFALRPAAAQLAHQFGGVVIAGGFSGGNHDGARRGWQPSE